MLYFASDTMSQINRPEISNNRFGSSSRANTYASGWSTDDDSLLPENPSAMDVERLRLQQRQMMKGTKLLYSTMYNVHIIKFDCTGCPIPIIPKSKLVFLKNVFIAIR